MAFVAKVGFNPEPVKPADAGPKNVNIFAVLPGLPEDRQQQILDGFQKQIDTARKELPRGR